MLISNVYGINNIFELQNNNFSKKNKGISATALFDTVSISDAAKETYKASLIDASNYSTLDDSTESALTKWFNAWHEGANFYVDTDNTSEINQNQLLQESIELKEKIEKQIDSIHREYTYGQFSVAPQEMLDRMRPLQQKLNAISAIGNSVVLDESTLNSAASYLQELEDVWNNDRSGNGSLSAQFKEAMSSKYNTISEDARARQIKEKILENMI